MTHPLAKNGMFDEFPAVRPTGDVKPLTSTAVCLVSYPDGSPGGHNFALRTIELPLLASNRIRVRNEFFSVDPSLRLRMKPDTSSYFPQCELNAPLEGWAVGRVIESTTERFAIGDAVFHASGWRDVAELDASGGMWTSPRLIDVESPRRFEEYLGALGPGGLTAWAGLRIVGELAAGDTVYVSAGAGAVGGLVVQISRILGHRTIASAGSGAKVDYLRDTLKADAAFSYREERPGDALARLAPDGIDLYFDNVGGEHLDAALGSLRPGGRVTLCGAISAYNTEKGALPGVKSLFSAIEKGLTVRGFLARMHAGRFDEFVAEMAGWIDAGEIVQTETIIDGLANSVTAFVNLFSGENTGKTIVRP